MKSKQDWICYFYFGCLLVLLSLGILTIFFAYYDISIQPGILTAITLIWSALLIGFEHNKKKVVPYLILAILAVTAAITIRVTDIDAGKEIRGYCNWVTQLLTKTLEEETVKTEVYYFVTYVLILIVISVLIYLCLKQYRLRIAGAIVCLVVLVLLSIVHQKVSKLGVSCLLTYSFIILTEVMYRRQYHNDESIHKKSMTFLAPFLILMAVMLMILPVKQEPIQWKIVKQCWYKISDQFEEWFSNIDLWMNPGKSEFSLSFSGYSDDGHVGGTLSETDELALCLTTTSLQTTNVYLTGNVKNYYDGTKWTNQTKDITYSDNAQEEYKEYAIDSIELLYAIDRYGLLQDYTAFYNLRGLTINYEHITTKSMFYPLKIYQLETTNSLGAYENQTANFIFDEPKHLGANYSFYYLNLNLGSSYLNQMIESQETYRYQDSDTTQQADFRERFPSNEWPKEMQIPEHLESILNKRAQMIRTEYTQVYEDLPDRVKQLAYDITKDYTSDYKKCEAIEHFLSGYTYSTTPSQPQAGQDLIDYMLFSSKEGYCTYYATAFAVMARCIGIPTRYVQGFCVPVSEQEDRFKYLVYSHNAHAWPEAYIEGIGWIPFEPTPTYTSQRYQPWLSKEDKKAYTQSQIGALEDDEEEEEIYDYPDFLKDLELDKKIEKDKTYRNAGLITIIILVIVLLSIPCYLSFCILRKRILYEKKNSEDRMYTDMEQIFKMMSYIHQEIEPLETLQSYFTRLANDYPELKSYFTSSYESYSRLRYDQETVSEKDQQIIRLLYQKLLDTIRVDEGRIRYWFILVRLAK